MTITDEQMVHGIIASTAEVCRVMLGEIVTAKPARLESMESEQSDGLAAFVGMTGPLVGTGSVSCDARLACRLAGEMWCSRMDGVDENVLDALGEVANMIIGSFKSSIEEQVGPMWLSVPTVVYGKNLVTHRLSKRPCTMVPFLCAGSELVVRVSLSESGEIRSLSRRPLAVLRGVEPRSASPYNG